QQIEPADDTGGVGEGRKLLDGRVAHPEIDDGCAEVGRCAALGDELIRLRAEDVDEIEALAAIFRLDQFSHHVTEDRLREAKGIEKLDEEIEVAAEPGFEAPVDLVGHDAP